jgi:hypothetical protein
MRLLRMPATLITFALVLAKQPHDRIILWRDAFLGSALICGAIAVASTEIASAFHVAVVSPFSPREDSTPPQALVVISPRSDPPPGGSFRLAREFGPICILFRGADGGS